MTLPSTTALSLLIGIIILSGAGAWISGQLVKQHTSPWSPAGGASGLFARMCQATERVGFSCAGALTGHWGQITVRIPAPSRDFTIGLRRVVVPVAFLGLAYFVFMAVWFAFIGGPRPHGYSWHRLPLILGFCGASLSLLFVSVMAFGIAPRCVWCLVTHGVNFLMVGAIWWLCAGAEIVQAGATIASSPEQMARTTVTSREALSAIAFSLILVAGLWLYRREHLAFRARLSRLMPDSSLVASLRRDPEFLLREYHAQHRHEIPSRPGGSAQDDLAQLVIFTDYECPLCYCDSVRVDRYASRAFGERLSKVVHHFPLCNTCNNNVKSAFHKNACEAAYAAEAARLQGGESAFWRMHTLLYKYARRLGKDTYRALAAQIGLDADRLLCDMKGDQVRRIVKADIALATELGVTGTPTMFLNGRRVTELCDGPVFWRTIAGAWASSESGGRDGADELQGELMPVGASGV